MSYSAEIKLASEEEEGPAPQALSAALTAEEETPAGPEGGDTPAGPGEGGGFPGGGDFPGGGFPGGGGFLGGGGSSSEAITDGRYYTVVDGELPEGMTLSQGGKISGTCYEAGTYTFTVELRQDGWVTQEATFTLEVVNDMFEFSDEGIKCSDENMNVTYTLAEGSSLPAGLTLNADGTISGTAAAGEYEITVVCDADGTVYTVTGTITVKESGGQTTPPEDDDQQTTPPEDGDQTTTPEETSDDNNGIAVAGLVLGIAGVVIAAGAVIVAVKKKKD